MPYLSKAGSLKITDDTWETNRIWFLKCYLGITVCMPLADSILLNTQVLYLRYNLLLL
jgi:hypothetical protein